MTARAPTRLCAYSHSLSTLPIGSRVLSLAGTSALIDGTSPLKAEAEWATDTRTPTKPKYASSGRTCVS